MKSKTSFFNKTIFMKNVTLYWPLWGIYTFLLLVMQPVILWMDYYNARFYSSYTQENYLLDLISALQLEQYTFLIAIAAVLFGMALFSYLYNSKSANMIHALPVDKRELFGTNVISGLTFLIVPQIVTFVVSLFVCIANGVTRIEFLGVWLLMAMAIAVIAYSFVTVCAMFTGLFFALPVYVLIVSLLSHWVYYIVYVVVVTWGYGVSNVGTLFQEMIFFFSPLNSFLVYVDLREVYSEQGILTGMQVVGEGVILIYLLIAIALYAIAYVTYQKRHIEKAGELITVQWLKPVFRWGAGISGGIFGSVFLYLIAGEMNIPCNMPGVIFIMLILGGISYFAADMFVRKTFHVFKKENWIGCGIFSAVLLICFFALFIVADLYEKYIPNQEEIVSADISMGFDVIMEGEEAGAIVDIHEQIVEILEICEEYDQRGYYSEPVEYVTINYRLKNGDYINRHYRLPSEVAEVETVIDKIAIIEKVPEVFLSSYLCKNYNEVQEFGTGWVEAHFVEEDLYDNNYDEEYKSKSITAEQVAILWNAVIADAKEGTLAKYNVRSTWGEEEKTGQMHEAYMELQFHDPDINYGNTINYASDAIEYTQEIVLEDSQNWSYARITFGADCQHIIKALVDGGIIHSLDDVCWEIKATPEVEVIE